MATIVDSYSEANQDDELGLVYVHPSALDTSAESQSFTGDGQKLHSCKFYLRVDLGSPGNLIARLYAHSGTFGISSVPTGGWAGKISGVSNPAKIMGVDVANIGKVKRVVSLAVLDSSDLIAASTIGGSLTLVEFTGFSGYTMVNGTKYCIVLEAYDGTWDFSNYIRVGADKSSPTHAGSRAKYKDGWIVRPQDICFYVYGVPA